MSTPEQREVWRRHVRQNYVIGDDVPEHYNEVQRKEVSLLTLRATGARKGIRHGNEKNSRKRIVNEPVCRLPLFRRVVRYG
jgi:hypothetical protein